MIKRERSSWVLKAIGKIIENNVWKANKRLAIERTKNNEKVIKTSGKKRK